MGDTFSYYGKKPNQATSEVCSDVSFSTSNLSRSESFKSHHGSFFADDPLPEDLKFLLPELDISIDEHKDVLPRKK
jgi:hypothetical protein